MKFILEGPQIKHEKNDLTVFNEGYIKLVQEEAIKAFKEIYFGPKYEKLKLGGDNVLKRLLKRLEDDLNKEKENSSKDINFDYVDEIIRQEKTAFAPI